MGGIFAVLLGLFALLYWASVRFSGPIKLVYGIMSGNPSFPNCHTTVSREATVGPLWYRVIEVGCRTESMHFVYAQRGTGPGFLMSPAFMSVVSPVPVSVREAAPDGFEVLLSKPLADGRTAVLIAFSEQTGMANTKFFDHGRETKSLGANN